MWYHVWVIPGLERRKPSQRNQSMMVQYEGTVSLQVKYNCAIGVRRPYITINIGLQPMMPRQFLSSMPTLSMRKIIVNSLISIECIGLPNPITDFWQLRKEGSDIIMHITFRMPLCAWSRYLVVALERLDPLRQGTRELSILGSSCIFNRLSRIFSLDMTISLKTFARYPSARDSI